MTKCKKCYSIDEQNAGQISRVASQKGVTESDIINHCIGMAMRSESELTSVERYHYRRVCIMKALDELLRLCGILQSEGGCMDKYKLALYVGHGNSVRKNRQFRNGEFELSLFEILNNIKDMDIDMFNQLTTTMSSFGKIRSRYFSLYPKNEKKRHTRQTEDNTITNNNTSIDSIFKRKELRKEKNSHIDSHEESVTDAKDDSIVEIKPKSKNNIHTYEGK